MNLGFLDAATLAEVLNDALERHADIGDAKTLRRYARWRKGENLAALAALDGIQRVFGFAQPGFAELRRTGMGWINRFKPVKSAMIRRAMGIAGDLPRCVREVGS